MAAGGIGLAFSAISGIMGAIGAMQQGSAAAAQAKYQSQVAKNNQIVAEQNAQYATAAGQSQAQQQDFKNRAAGGAIEAAQGASGIQLDSPTLTQVREGAGQLGRLDTETIMANAQLRSRASSAQAANFGAEAGLQDMRASNARSSALTGAFGSLLGGATSFADKWARYQPSGY